MSAADIPAVAIAQRLVRDLQAIVDEANGIVVEDRPVRLSDWVDLCHGRSKAAGWHDYPEGQQRQKGTMLMLIVSEVAEAMEGERKDLMDDHLPHRKMAEVEMADAVIRIMDYCGLHGYDLEGAMREKLEYNRTRQDHSKEAREQAGGKAF